MRKHISTGLSEQYRLSFKDGAVQAYQSIDDVIALPNVGKREIVSLEVEIQGDHHSGARIRAALKLADVSRESANAHSAEYHVTSTDAGVVKLIQVELDEFLMGIRKSEFWRWIAKNGFLISVLPLIFAMITLMYMMNKIGSDNNINWLKDNLDDSMSPAKVIVRYEEWRNAQSNRIEPRIMLIPMAISMVSIIFVRPEFLASMFKTYVFYTGGMIQIVNQRRALHAVFWGGIVLALFVGVAGNWISSLLLKV